jgi:hypothetical protein
MSSHFAVQYNLQMQQEGSMDFVLLSYMGFKYYYSTRCSCWSPDREITHRDVDLESRHPERTLCEEGQGSGWSI